MNVVLTGATGMIGQAALIECLESPVVTKVLSIGRRKLDQEHPKLEQLIHADFTDFSPVQDQITAFKPGACFHCMGVSSLGMNEADYTRLTYDVTASLAEAIYAANYRASFIYVSGAGTDRSEKGRLMWARVKGRTENYILDRGFGAAYAFRIGAVLPRKGVKSSTGWVNFFYVVGRPFFGLLKQLDSVVTSDQMGQAMIKLARTQVQSGVVEAAKIKALT